MSQRGGVAYTYPKVPGNRKSRLVLMHRAIVERVLGYTLPKGVEIHHVNEDVNDFRNSNLVVCQDRAYHKLLHMRMRALRACGHADWRRCVICKQYSPVEELRFYKNGKGQNVPPFHPACGAKTQRINRIARLRRQRNGEV